MPHPFFGAKDVCYIEKKVLAKKKAYFLARRAVPGVRTVLLLLYRKYQTGQKGEKGISPLSGGDPYEITLIRLNQVSLDRRRREKVIWEMITEHI